MANKQEELNDVLCDVIKEAQKLESDATDTDEASIETLTDEEARSMMDELVQIYNLLKQARERMSKVRETIERS